MTLEELFLPSALALSLVLVFMLDVWGHYLFCADLKSGGAQCGVQILCSLEESS